MFDLLTNPDDRAMFELMMIGTTLGRPFAAPPGTPRERVDVLRKAFDATMKDPAFLAEARQMDADITPTPGEEVQRMMAKTYAAPKAVIDRVKALVHGGAK